LPGHDVAERACEHVDAAAGRIWHKNMHGLGRKFGLGGRSAAGGDHRHKDGSNPRPPAHALSSRSRCLVVAGYGTQGYTLHRRAAQISQPRRHVDNPARGVKVRRLADYDRRARTREDGMAVVQEKASPQTSEGKASEEKASQDKTWHGIVLQTLKRNDIRLVPYVPDRVLTTLIKNLHADPFFTTFPTAREEEAVGIVSGAWMGGLKGAVLMQTSGFATLANVLASLALPYQIPLVMFVSERGTLGEFNYGQSLVCRTMRPVLDSLAMEHHTATRLDEFEFIVDRSIKQAITTQAPVALILSPLLTGGKVFDK
jgi:sulfopyruvate decarboxylase alpha subunit